MSLSCETEYQVRNDFALRFSLVSKPTPVLEYIKTISSLVGASHILAVFEEGDAFKVFFDDKGYVDALIRTGIHVMGRHVTVDYVVPPGIKIVLSNVDPVISNFDLLRFLSSYGTVVSPIIRPPVSDDMELCHISYGVRHVYMVLNAALPEKFLVKCDDVMCSVKVRICDASTCIDIKEDDSNSDVENDLNPIIDYSNLDDSTSPVVVSVESAAPENNIDEEINLVETVLKDSRPALKKRRRRVVTTFRKKRAKVTPSSRAATKIKLNVKHKWLTKNKIKFLRKGKRVRKVGRPLRKRAELSVKKDVPQSPSDIHNSLSTNLSLSNGDSSSTYKSSFNDVLTAEKLEMFLEEVKHNRAPLEVAKKFLGNSWTKEMLDLLIKQLEKYKSEQTLPNIKLRVSRVTKLMNEAMQES